MRIKSSSHRLTKFFLQHCMTRAKIYPPYFIVQQTICQGSFGVLSKSIIFQMASMGSSVMTPSHHWQRQLTLETGPLGGSKFKILYPTFFFTFFFFWRVKEFLSLIVSAVCLQFCFLLSDCHYFDKNLMPLLPPTSKLFWKRMLNEE